MKKLYKIMFFFLLTSCHNRPDKHHSDFIESIDVNDLIKVTEEENILSPSESDSIIDNLILSYIDSIENGTFPIDLLDPCFERKVLRKKEPKILVLHGLKKQIIADIDHVSSLKYIIDNKEKFNCTCNDDLHNWSLPIDTSFRELNLWDLAVKRKKELNP